MCGCGEVRELRFRFGPAEKQGREGMQPLSLAKERPASCISMFWLVGDLNGVYFILICIIS